MSNFILLHRRIKDRAEPALTWVNVANINTIATTTEGNGSRITMRDGFLLVEEDVNTVMNKIWYENHDR